MPFGSRSLSALFLAIPLCLGLAAGPCLAGTTPKHPSAKRTKAAKKHGKKTARKKAKSSRKKRKRTKRAHRKNAARPARRIAPRARRLPPNVAERSPPPPANAYSGSPLDPAPAPAAHETIPLRDPSAPAEERRVHLDMTKPYGRVVPSPTPGAERGLASVPPDAAPETEASPKP